MGFINKLKGMVMEDDGTEVSTEAPVETVEKPKFSQSVELDSGFDGSPTDDDIDRVSKYVVSCTPGVVSSFMSTLESLSGVIADEKQRFQAAFAASFKEGKITKASLLEALEELSSKTQEALSLYEPEWIEFTEQVIDEHVRSIDDYEKAIAEDSERIAELKQEIADLKQGIADHETKKIDESGSLAKAQSALRGRQESAQTAVDESVQETKALAGKVEAFIE